MGSFPAAFVAPSRNREYPETFLHSAEVVTCTHNDMGTKEEVKPNFRTPPRRGKLVADWHARTTYDMK
jgi:hypothetical protein